MEDRLILVCRHGDEVDAILIKRGMDFGAVMEKICQRWNDLDPKTMILSYSLINDDAIVMENDVDLATLFELAQAGGLNDIEVVVRDGANEFSTAGGSVEPVSNLQVSNRKISLTSNKRVLTQGDDDDMVIPSFVTHKKKILKSANWALGIKQVGQRFEGGVVVFREVLRKYAIERRIEYVLVKNDKERVTAQCKYRKGEKECMWEVHGRVCQANGFFFIRKFVNDHKCGAVLRTTNVMPPF